MTYRKIAALRTPAAFLDHLARLGIEMPFEESLEPAPASPLAQPLAVDGLAIGNRFCVQPMEGWDGTPDGRPTDLTRRRWTRFGLSGAKLIWGGEAVAVRPDGRANPNQLLINEENLPDLAGLRAALVEAHEQQHGSSRDLLVGLQLTHSGRFSRPHDKSRLEPVIAYHHPYLDRKFGIPASQPVISDDEIAKLTDQFVEAAALAYEAGFQFVDIKHCHGYLGHELLGAHTRPGPYGGSFENRTRFLRDIVGGIRRRVPTLRIGVRVSAFDLLPFEPGPDGVGVPVDGAGEHYPYGFGIDAADPLRYDLTETVRFLSLLERAASGLPGHGNGRSLYNRYVRPFKARHGFRAASTGLRYIIQRRFLEAGKRLAENGKAPPPSHGQAQPTPTGARG